MQPLFRTIGWIAWMAVFAAVGYLAYRQFLGAPGSTAGPSLGSADSSTAAAPPDSAPPDSAPLDNASLESPRPVVPASVPDIRLPDLAGQLRGLREFRGQPLLINFWATWCEPCRREIPMLNALKERHRQQGLEIVGIAVDFPQAVAEYRRTTPMNYPLLIAADAGSEVARAFGLELVLPISVFAAADGTIISLKLGELHADEADATLLAMGELAAGRIELATAQARIAEQTRTFALRRALQKRGANAN